MTDRRPGDGWGTARRGEVAQLAGLEPDGPVGVDDALGIPGRARGEGDQGRRGKVDRHGSVNRLGIEQALKGYGTGRELFCWCCPDDGPPGRPVTQQVLVGGEIVGVAELVGSDDELGLGDADDVLEFLGTVEVDDGHHDGAGVGGAPEGDRGLHPVRELEHDDVAGSDAVVAEPSSEASGGLIDVGDGAAPWPHRRMHDECSVAHGVEALCDQITQTVLGPPALGEVPLR